MANDLSVPAIDGGKNMDAASKLANFLKHPPAAKLILAGLSVTPVDDESTRFAVGKPKSTAGHFVPNYETNVIGCDDHEEWGGISFDGPVLTVYEEDRHWVVENTAVWVAGIADSPRGPGSFRECFDTLPAAVDFVMRFYFRDRKTFERLTKARR